MLSAVLQQSGGPTGCVQMATALPTFHPVEYHTKNAFHGTNQPDALSIWKDKKFRTPDTNVDNRFGPGYYFWENTKAAAIKWAKIWHRTNDIAIIRAAIHCHALLDLLTAEHYYVLEKIQALIARDRGLRPDQVRHAAVMSFLAKANLIDGVRLIAAVSPKTKVHDESKLAGPFDVMLCIYVPMNIELSAIDTSDV